MENLTSISFRKQVRSLTIVILAWFLYSSLYFYFKETPYYVISGIFSLVGEAGLDLLLVILSYLAWKQTKDRTRKFFFLLTIAFSAAFLSDFIYNYILNIEQVKINSFLDSLFDIPFMFSLFFYMLAWVFMFISEGDSQVNKKVNYSPYIFASFCLIRAKVTWLKYISIGYLVVVGSDLIIRYGVVNNNIITINPLETTWVLGLALVFLGFFLSKKRKQVRAES